MSCQSLTRAKIKADIDTLSRRRRRPSCPLWGHRGAPRACAQILDKMTRLEKPFKPF